MDARSTSSCLVEQPERRVGWRPVPVFSFLGDASQHPRQIAVLDHARPTSVPTTSFVRASTAARCSLASSKAWGPRYCPSIEDKVNRFADKDVAPDLSGAGGSLRLTEFYPNGISTSLAVRRSSWRPCTRLRGLGERAYRPARLCHRVRLLRSSCAEGEFSRPRQSMGCSSPGRSTGTTGYEEAAAQGLFAGINAALQVHATSRLGCCGGTRLTSACSSTTCRARA